MPKSGALVRNVLTFGEMDPMLKLRFSSEHEYSTSVDMNSHFHPKWSDLIKAKREPQDQVCIVECWQFNESSASEIIGVGAFSLTPFLLGKKLSKAVDLFFDGAFVGMVVIDALFVAE